MSKKIAVMISGKQGSGKDAVAPHIEHLLRKNGFAVRKDIFADKIYQWHNHIIQDLREMGYEPKDKYGDLLQFLGTEFGRKEFGDDIWVDQLIVRSKGWYASREEQESLLPGMEPKSAILMTDMRKKNEFSKPHDILKLDGVDVVRIRLEASEECRKARATSWRKNTAHSSETDLDDWLDRFEKVFDTENFTKVQTIEQIYAFLGERFCLSDVQLPWEEIRSKPETKEQLAP